MRQPDESGPTRGTFSNLNREERQIPISSVVLASQRVPLDAASHSINQRVHADAANRLLYEGQERIPNVTRTFSRRRDLYVFLQAYFGEVAGSQPLVAYVTFYRGKGAVFESTTFVVTDGPEKSEPYRSE
jgi:hypothetical protein